MAKIGIFDSGIGGLTLASEVKKQLPDHSIIYFGDTAHFPYGDKSTAAIQSYAIKICNLLLEQGCDVILIACNSASASAYDLVKEYVGSRARVFNVIDSIVDDVTHRFKSQKVGLIGTKRTIGSNVYFKKINKCQQNVELVSLATPLLAPMIEEGFFKKEISHQIIAEYLSDPMFEGITSIILGCTHYPLIKDSVADYFKTDVEVIDSPEIVVRDLKKYLLEKNLPESPEVTHKFFVSDFTQSFNQSTRLFFGEKIELEEYKLWD